MDFKFVLYVILELFEGDIFNVYFWFFFFGNFDFIVWICVNLFVFIIRILYDFDIIR